ncbi:MAG: hypothetical protein COV07_02560 [Candidatus Vogelbacteria bacterium CG10_big_fil_rev_8_21_14_0_10_45_14]|uniref:Uncharacterized protein n=1 Tax=Candidatus Vogelbacteria bacterium CG10_big_fil_rev_8_21_14_0_10_45_14 TaxID=1975042 RepID=A0A2H0RL32_9BACT|nr:MAG: hypothetical protein COV07_02560 [Candidatus Vogelbacteria bacterium CG10_big_fil_rev_8_21_14_0_10_45_14]
MKETIQRILRGKNVKKADESPRKSRKETKEPEFQTAFIFLKSRSAEITAELARQGVVHIPEEFTDIKVISSSHYDKTVVRRDQKTKLDWSVVVKIGDMKFKTNLIGLHVHHARDIAWHVDKVYRYSEEGTNKNSAPEKYWKIVYDSDNSANS